MTAGETDSGQEHMGTVTAADGAPIAYWRRGDGPPLLLVHGISASHHRWASVLPALAERFTVYAFDRRGRGGSGDTEGYEIEREFADTAAVIDAIAATSGPVNYLGHSYGAMTGLEAALQTANIRKMVLYEPPYRLSEPFISPPDSVARLEERLTAGDRDGVVEVMMGELVGVPPEALAEMRTTPAWAARMAAAHTIPRELRALETYTFEPERFRNVETPTLFLLGGASPPHMHRATHAAAQALPNAQTVILPGQGHVAMDSATGLFMEVVARFLASP
jgi:pimeloyl-ACP methyl ester carboxylesterase